jgi:hypothetical protein
VAPASEAWPEGSGDFGIHALTGGRRSGQLSAVSGQRSDFHVAAARKYGRTIGVDAVDRLAMPVFRGRFGGRKCAV